MVGSSGPKVGGGATPAAQVSGEAVAELSRFLVELLGLDSKTLKRLTEAVRDIDRRERQAAKIIEEADARDAGVTKREQAVAAREAQMDTKQEAIAIVCGALDGFLEAESDDQIRMH